MTSIAALACAGCHATALVPPDDVAFNAAQERLQRTTAEVDAMGAPLAERAAFMQAEAFYRYRFSTERHGLAFGAEAAAAATDLPVFQSLAGSLDLLPLRLAGADAATQLWEGFVRRYPSSALKPLALYRLGWSYRSVGISGLPREDGADAFAALARCDTPEPIRSAAIAARAVPWKSKDAASTWSLLPGAGQIYVGDTASGIVRLGIAALGAAAVVVPAVVGATRASELTWRHDWPLLVVGTAGLIVLSLDYTLSYEDALRGVVRFNERQEQRFEATHPDAP